VRVQGRSTTAYVGSDPPFLSVSIMEPVEMGAGMQADISYRIGTKVRLDGFRSINVAG
jgi:hypothetical protein